MRQIVKKHNLAAFFSAAAAVIAAIVLVTAFGACKKQQIAQGDTDVPKFENGALTEPYRLKVPDQMYFDFTIAKEQGFFEEVGIIKEDTGKLPSGTTVVQSVISGDNDLMGSGHVTDIVNARNAGAKIKIVMQGHIDNAELGKGHMYLYVRNDSPIQSGADLKGKKIGVVDRGTCSDLMLAEYLYQNGLTEKDTEIITMPDLQQITSLKSGQIDVAAIHVLYAMNAEAQNTPDNKIFRLLETSYNIGYRATNSTLGADAFGTAVRAFSERFIAEHPSIVKAYIAANLKAQRWSNAHFEEASKIYADTMGLENAGGNWFDESQAGCDEAKLQFWIDMMEKHNWIEKGSVNVKDIYTNDLNPYLSGELEIPVF